MTKRVRLLYVVARDRPDLKERLTAAFLDTDNVEVIVDSRTTRTSDRGPTTVEHERRVLGYTPKVEFDEGLRRAVEYFQSRPPARPRTS